MMDVLGLKNSQHFLGAHMFEIDKEKINKIYNIQTKKKEQYRIVERKIIYAKEEKKIVKSMSEIEKDYYGNYKYFRAFLMTGFDAENSKEELKSIRRLIEHSRNLRANLEKHFEINPDEMEIGLPVGVDTHTQKEHSGDNKQLSQSIKTSTFSKTKFANDFVKMCRLLKLKSGEGKDVYQNDYKFKLYSELEKPSDVYSFKTNENFLNVKLQNTKLKLISNYHTEDLFCNFAKNYKKTIENIEDAEFLTSPEIKKKLPVQSIDSMFQPRDLMHFCKIDAFMSLYTGTKPNLNMQERELYENIYGILSKCGYVNFLSFLYSRNNLFKYIYDEFSIKKVDTNLDQINLSEINSEVDIEKFVNESAGNLFNTNTNVNANANANANSPVIQPAPRKSLVYRHSKCPGIPNVNMNYTKNPLQNFDDVMACFYIDKISFLPDKIEEKHMDCLRDSTNLTLANADFIGSPKSFPMHSLLTQMKAFSTLDFNHLLVITKNERLKIISFEEGPDSYGTNTPPNSKIEIEEDIKKITLFKIDRQTVKEKHWISNNNTQEINEAMNEVFGIQQNSNVFYIIEVKGNYSTKKTFDSGQQLKQSMSNFYHIFKINSDNAERFESVVNRFKILFTFNQKDNENVFTESSAKDFATNKKNLSVSKPEQVNQSFKDFKDDKKLPEEENLSYKNKITLLDRGRISRYQPDDSDEEDHLNQNNMDVLVEGVMTVQKKKVGKSGVNSSGNIKKVGGYDSSQKLRTYKFRIHSEDYNFCFKKNSTGENVLCYYPDDKKLPNEIELLLREFREFVELKGNEGKSTEIIMRYLDRNKGEFNITCYDLEETRLFVDTLKTYLPLVLK